MPLLRLLPLRQQSPTSCSCMKYFGAKSVLPLKCVHFQSNEICVIVAFAGGVTMTCVFVLLAILLWTSFQFGVQVILTSPTDIQALRVPVAFRNYEPHIYTSPSM